MRGAIFDVDGTLLDSMQVWWDVVVDFFKEHGVELPYEEAKEYKEMTMKESIPTIKNRLNLDLSFEELCKTAFTRLGVWNYIDACAFSSEVGVNKSNPDVYLLAAKRIGIPPEECTVFEDITTGIGGAKKGGFSTCAIFDETNADETDALKQLSDHYITGWEELL